MDNIDLDKVGFDDVITPQEQYVILNNLTDELLLENIYDQIEKPVLDLYDPTNFIDVFESRYKFLNQRFKDVPDFIVSLNDTRRHFYINTLNKISKKFKFGLDTNTERIYVITKVLYEFFVLNYKDNIRTFFIEYIKENKKNIVVNYDETSKNLDLVSLKKIFKNKNDAVILSNIYNIVDLIVQQDLMVKTIFDLIIRIDSSEFTNFFINTLFIEEEIITTDTDFSKIFFRSIVKKSDGYTKIMNEIQMELFEIFPKK